MNNRGQTFGLEPHFVSDHQPGNTFGKTKFFDAIQPCCTTNHPQGFPKFLAASFVKVGSNGLGHALLSPGQVITSLDEDNNVVVSCETNYPLEHLLAYTIDAQRSFDFYVRVPEWSITEESFITKNNGQKEVIEPDPHTGMTKIAIAAGTTTLRCEFSSRLRVEHRANHAVSIYYGSLLYSLEIGKIVKADPPHDWSNRLPLPESIIVPQVHDYNITNSTAWAVAIDLSTLQVHPRPFDSPLVDITSNQPDSFYSRPIHITVHGCEIPWGYSKGVAAEPPPVEMRRCMGDSFEVRLIPFGTAQIHMSELPTIDLSFEKKNIIADQIPIAA